MDTLQAEDRYSLGRMPTEHERLRAQARLWEEATAGLLDRVGLAAGARCLDAGCGPGETMRLMAERVGPAGSVLGIDVDEDLGAEAVASLRAAGHAQCAFARADLTADGPLPGGPFDLVYARLLLFHLPRAAVLRRLWDAVAPGGVLVVQDYDLRRAGAHPPLDGVERVLGVVIDAFTAAGCDVSMGLHLADLFAEAGIGAPDGADVAGRVVPLAQGAPMLAAVHESLLPAALANGVTTERHAVRDRAGLAADAERHPGRAMLWPLLVGAWKRA